MCDIEWRIFSWNVSEKCINTFLNNAFHLRKAQKLKFLSKQIGWLMQKFFREICITHIKVKYTIIIQQGLFRVIKW